MKITKEEYLKNKEMKYSPFFTKAIGSYQSQRDLRLNEIKTKLEKDNETIFMNPAEYEAGTREEFAAELRSEELLDAKETLTSIEQKEEGNSRSSLPRVVASVLVDETEKQLRR